MYVNNVTLKSFRNYNEQKINLTKSVNIFCGANAQGKTNLLEAIYFCGMGRSHRTNVSKELVMFGNSDAHIRLFVSEHETNVSDKIDVHIQKDGKKGVAINGLAIKKMGDLFGHLLCVMFSPEDLQLIKHGPHARRRFLDMELCQLSSVYYYELKQYHKVLNERNNLLKQIRTNRSHKETLFVWDEQLVSHGIKIIDYRFDFIEKLNELASEIHGKITKGKEHLHIVYKQSVTKEQFMEKLTKSFERDVLCGSTTLGIHKDDILFFINNIDSKAFGSQGQQRTAALSTKLAEIEIIKSRKHDTPVLLLDDVMSELDLDRQSFLLEGISGVQTLITCTGSYSEIEKKCNSVKVFFVSNGIIEN